jgi:hypothetical protein
MTERRPVLPAIVLFVLSPVVAELLTSSSPPVLFFSPFGLPVMLALYGSGALLVRELTCRWKKGWPTLIALGAAYGIAEEGLMVRSFFDPRWPGIGLLGVYGRWGGVNWVWAVQLTLFHSLFSVTIPIILVGLLFPRSRGKSLLGTAGIIIFSVLLAVVVFVAGRGLTSYAAPPVPYLLCLAAGIGMVLVARILPEAVLPGRASDAILSAAPRPPHNRRFAPVFFYFLGLGATIVFFLLSWVVPGLPVPPLLNVALVLVVVSGVILGVWRLGERYSFGDMEQWALAAGALSFFMLLSPLIQLDRSRANLQGMALVGLGMAGFLVLILILVRRREKAR